MLKEPKAHGSAMNLSGTENILMPVRFGNEKVSADEKRGRHYHLVTRDYSTVQGASMNTVLA
jgi:hypothetical protein